MKAKSVLGLCLFLCLISCNKYENNVTLKYQRELKLFPSYMVDFFPDTLIGIYSTLENIDTTSQCIYYMNCNLDSKNTFKLQKYLANKSLQNYICLRYFACYN